MEKICTYRDTLGTYRDTMKKQNEITPVHASVLVDLVRGIAEKTPGFTTLEFRWNTDMPVRIWLDQRGLKMFNDTESAIIWCDELGGEDGK